MIGRETREAAVAILALFKERGLTVATAESCTGGLLAAALTSVSGSSAVVERGFVTYTNTAKIQSLRHRRSGRRCSGQAGRVGFLRRCEGERRDHDGGEALRRDRARRDS